MHESWAKREYRRKDPGLGCRRRYPGYGGKVVLGKERVHEEVNQAKGESRKIYPLATTQERGRM